MSAVRDEFMAGYLIAVANIVHLHDEPTIAADVLAEAGLHRSAMDGMDLSEYDTVPLNELFDELDRQRRSAEKRLARKARGIASEVSSVGGLK